MDGKDFEQYLPKLRIDIERTLNDDVPLVAANKVASLFRRNFRTQSFFGKKWKEVQRRIPGTKPYKAAGYKIKGSRHPSWRTDPILTISGDLGRSIRYKVEKGTAIVYSDLKYSEAHNEGTTTAGRNHSTTIPQRQFIGDHEEVDKVVKATITKALNDLFK
jgi:phage gpG-like protein